ncbi:DUF998 domain-containing protein [Saccharomonospora sp. NB11]|jgi:hypothetical protein|uniref:DUF998 domain-containing protein n=1 Tax=Saccharomonospora sp. NB11 TaxID=1642298 RepID=UPI0018D0F6B7|nr:DUF998 domain-containing protein [Saccharomonospora sp. NB11]
MGHLGTNATTVERAPARVRAWTFAATAALGWALFTLTILHVVSSFDPLTDPVSRYAFTDAGQGMLEASLLSFAVGVVAVRGTLAAAGLRVSRTTTALVVTAAGGLVAAALFPAAFESHVDPASGLIHQYGSLLAFLSVPGIALSLLDQLRDSPDAGLRAARRGLQRVVWPSIGLLVAFGASYVADKLTGGPPPLSAFVTLFDLLPEALIQRAVFLADFVLLAALLVVANRAAWSRASR